jgi:hypothetical protein
MIGDRLRVIASGLVLPLVAAVLLAAALSRWGGRAERLDRLAVGLAALGSAALLAIRALNNGRGPPLDAGIGMSFVAPVIVAALAAAVRAPLARLVAGAVILGWAMLLSAALAGMVYLPAAIACFVAASRSGRKARH